MKKVIIYGDDNRHILSDTIIGFCSRNGGAFVSDDSGIYETCASPEYLIIVSRSITNADFNGIAVIGGNISPESCRSISIKSRLVITDSENQYALRLLKNCGRPVIGCSMSSRDSVSVSCIDDDYRLLCIQRSIPTISGDIIEPCELKIRVSREMPVFPFLAACSVLLCSNSAGLSFNSWKQYISDLNIIPLKICQI